MKLIIQIPCYNEEQTLPITLKEIPRQYEGIDEVEILIIDDGSTDNTLKVAKELGVHHVIKFTNNKGLAEAFMAGLDAALKLGADIIVNTDADNQYCGDDIRKLIKPIVNHEADMVIGNRNVNNVAHFSFIKKKLQLLGSWVVRSVSNTNIPDTTSGFRAYSREAALRMNVISKFTYTLETIIQAGKKNIALAHVPIHTNDKLRESRLFTSVYRYIKKSMATIFRIYTMYEPLKMFFSIGGSVVLMAFLISLRYVYFFFVGHGKGHVQSLILATILYIIGFQVIVIGLVADLIGANRRLIEEALYKIRKIELNSLSKSDEEAKKQPS